MITEEMLREAAHKASEVFTAYYERDYDPENQYVFPPEFEKKIERLKRRAKHPVFYKTMHRAASIVLAMLIAGGAWITVDAEARATFVGWVKEIYETYFVYRFEDVSHTNENSGIADYRPTWLPGGYEEFYCDDSEDTVFVTYSNGAGQMMNFSYIHAPDETMWLIDRNNAVIAQVKVNDSMAELFISTEVGNANAIMWSNADNTAFYLSAFVDKDELLRIAESVAPVEKS